MGRIKKQVESSMTVDMQFAIDFPLLAAKNKQQSHTTDNKCPVLDFFNSDKPRGYNRAIDVNNLAITYLQLHNVDNTDKNNNVVEMYNSINKGQCIPLKTYVAVINNFESFDKVKNTIKETIEIYGKCPLCNVQFVTINELTYCPICALETTNISAKDVSSTNGIDKFKSTYLYKRVSHYINKLDKLTACENTKVPQDVINIIREETKKEHRKIENITIDRIKYYLSKYNLTKYSDNVNQIYKILTGKQRVFIPPIIHNILVENFTKIDQVLSQLTEQEGNVNNFLNYSYLHYKICEHLNLKKYQYLFPLCKSQDKIFAHDAIWKVICSKIGWQFIPTI